ncbi:transcriptional protein SWT1 isoform X2 [Danio aesculapii]|uniref:transcriptional protein SWT1 isoform X2 n=1 Tax=Danio aesculapii TaxID=1142201 RepID=UPI0024C0A683|nr:transcriptional protein SWT1 isoform X2 [Danio aesculapii]
MASKKSKKKKHKKEESCLCEDEKEERDTKRVISSKSKHHHRVSFDKDEAKGRRATVSLPEKTFEAILNKRDAGESKKKRTKKNKNKGTEKSKPVLTLPNKHDKKCMNVKGKHKNASPHISEKKPKDQPSSEVVAKKRQKLVSRKPASEDLRWTLAKDDCLLEKLQQRRMKPMKRRLSQELHVQPKRRNVKNGTDVAQTAPTEMRKKLVGKRSKKINQPAGASLLDSPGKTMKNNSKEAMPAVKHVRSKPKLLEDISPKKKDHVKQRKALGVLLREKHPAFCGSIANTKFKIPKLPSAVKAQTNTDIFNVNSSDRRTQITPQPSLPGSSPAKPQNFLLRQQMQKPEEVSAQTSHELSSPCSSRLSYVSHQVQQVHTDDKREVTMSDSAFRNEQHISSQKAAKTYDFDQEVHLVEELHLARSERRLDVNLEQNCGELTCMDIDPPEEGANTIPKKQAVLIVLDTNVLLSHLEFVKKIRSCGFGGLGFPTLLIPWVVLQELDYLKSGKLSSKVEDKARPAVHYIYSCLKNQEPRLMGQSMQLASQADCGPGVVNNDDRVLQCCLQYQALYPEGALVLCTNDKNLCSKALLSGVKAYSKADLVNEAEGATSKILEPDLQYFYAHPAVISPARPLEKEKQGSQDNRNSIVVDEQELSEYVSLLESCLQAALSEVLTEEMNAAYGDLWTEIVYVKPPWSLEGLLKCFKKHWIAVFGLIINRSLLSCVEMLNDCLCSDRSVEHTSVLSAVSLATELLSALSGRSQYNGHVAHALSTLHTLQQRLQSPKAPLESGEADDEDSLMAEIEEDAALPPSTSHQEVWALFESIWNNVCQISTSLFSALHYTPGTTESSLRSTSPPPQEALSCLQRLSAALKQLLEALQRLLSADSSVQDAQTLLSFIETSEIAAMEPRFTARSLFDCVSQQEYREKLCVGGAQLSELCVNLDQCAAAVRSWP